VPVLVASVLSLKGGVGKTTVTLGLASAAVHRGLNTLLVDLDPQMNATATVAPELDGVADGRLKWSVAEVLDDPSSKVMGRTVRESGWGEHLRVLPGSERTEIHNHPDPGSKKLFRLSSALERVRPEPDLVLIDCPPSLGQLTRSALIAADRAVLVTEPSLFAVTGVQRALEAVQTERFRPRVTEQEYRLAELRELFGPLVLSPVLPDRSAIQQAQGAAVPIHQWPTAGAREIAQSFDQLLDRLMRAGKQRSRK
jgi:cellulose biosynthesis protein BcsQ